MEVGPSLPPLPPPPCPSEQNACPTAWLATGLVPTVQSLMRESVLQQLAAVRCAPALLTAAPPPPLMLPPALQCA